MGSLTVRNIGEDVKRRLRVRAARNGRSMEEEIRHILASADAPGSRAPEADEAPAPRGAKRSSEPAAKRVLLIIGGGIAAYKSLDLIRRLQERGATVRVVMTKAAQEFITPLSAGALAGEAAFVDLFDVMSEFDVGSYPARA